MDVTKVEQSAYIEIAVRCGRNARECHAELREALGNLAIPYRTVARWGEAFKQGRESTVDLPRGGRVVLADHYVRVAVVDQYLMDCTRWTVMQLAQHTGIPALSVRRILRQDANVRKICAKWVAHHLTEAEKWTRYETCRFNQERFHREGIICSCGAALAHTLSAAVATELNNPAPTCSDNGLTRLAPTRFGDYFFPSSSHLAVETMLKRCTRRKVASVRAPQKVSGGTRGPGSKTTRPVDHVTRLPNAAAALAAFGGNCRQHTSTRRALVAVEGKTGSGPMDGGKMRSLRRLDGGKTPDLRRLECCKTPGLRR
ncbi:hypothetical protein PR048_009800 [Dryococelus australis]|uniref:Mos1 transposase HTH domain-containing protein n=1 Tax=Dryococelus australis TaxID=614101 RepID=A0ABQ9I0Y6_9NEOP|nr:hypothetical protein PR048_009800 [Dryococelus australis]